MKDLEFLTTIEDVKALAKLVLGNDPKITGWEFLNKCCVEVNQNQLPHPFRWRLRMKVMYHGKPLIEDFILDENFNGKITRHGPLKSKYKTDLFKDDRDYRSFEVFMNHELPVVKITFSMGKVQKCVQLQFRSWVYLRVWRQACCLLE